MSQLSASLHSFKKKIEEAVVLVPAMIAEEKLKAVQFWNVVSERLQEIVNNSAADINALAMRLEQEEVEQQNQQSMQQSLEHSKHSSTQSIQSVPMNSTDSSSDKQEIYLPIMSSNCDQNIMSNTNSSNNLSEFSQTIGNTSDVIDEHLASVITSYHDSHETHPNQESPQLLIAFEKPHKEYKESQALSSLPEHEINTINTINSINCQNEMNSTSATSVIQEVDQNLITSQRRNVIQSTQRAIQVIEQNMNNCCNGFEEKNKLNNHLISDNTSDDSMIKIIENDESQGDSSTNHIFNETSFDVSYASSEDFEQKNFKISEIENNEKTNNNLNNKKNKKKTKLNKKSSEKSCEKSLFECDICHKLLPNNSALVTHKWVHSKPYSCSECDARFSTKGNLLVHQRRHTGEKPFACDRCPASFSTKGNLKRHIKAHSGERPWKCSQCDSRFTEKKSLKVHMRRHTGEKPYQCSVCGKSFSQTGVLQTHMALHLDERKHLCELCGKAFRQRSQLRLHVLRHEGVKRWDCSDCEAKFLTKGDLERHHRVHTGERPFVCDLCGKTFTRQQSLNEHSNRHYGLKPYSCTVCSKTFAEMSACYKHIKVHKKQQTIQMSTKNDLINKNTNKKIDSTYNQELVVHEPKNSNSNLQNTRSHINVIQSTTTSTPDKRLIYMNTMNDRNEQICNNINVSIDDSIISSNSNNNTNDNNSIEYVDFAAINLLANTSTAQQNF